MLYGWNKKKTYLKSNVYNHLCVLLYSCIKMFMTVMMTHVRILYTVTTHPLFQMHDKALCTTKSFSCIHLTSPLN